MTAGTRLVALLSPRRPRPCQPHSPICRPCATHQLTRVLAAAMNTEQQHAWLTGRTLRRIGFDRNSMRGRSDRLQAILRAALLAAFLIAGPLAAGSFGHHVFAAGMQSAGAQAAARQRVPAVVVHVTLLATAWRHPTLSGPHTVSALHGTRRSASNRPDHISQPRVGRHGDRLGRRVRPAGPSAAHPQRDN